MKNSLFPFFSSLFSFVFLFYSSFVFAQTPISGVVNTYVEVVSVDNVANTVTVSSSANFQIGDHVLIIQMQGATIDQSQTAAFGSITNYNNCGNYEFQVICDVQGNTFTFNHNLINSYTSSESVQIVKVASYQNALLSGDLTAQPWNGTTGGVLVIDAVTLDLGAFNIDVTGQGFRGGEAVPSGQNCFFLSDESYYSSFSSTDEKAKKGEGIAKYIPNKECGRGSQANGGGGGNNHNGGGSGGSNYGAGGEGGQRIKESAFVCGSVTGTSAPSLSSGYTGNKIFMGGGGGAGHGNNTGINGESGLNGGGIILIKAQSITGNTQSILANGTDSPINANGDGAGGGGAGGTVLIQSNTYTNTLNIEANGSNGINTNNGGSNNCSGPGGGAGGGIIWVSGNSVSPNIISSVLGGSAGIIATTSQTNCTVGSTNGGQSGQDGIVQSNLILNQGNITYNVTALNQDACDGFVSPSGKYIWTTSGTYMDTLIPQVGCDSVFVINLTINQVDTTVFQSQLQLVSAVAGAVYQWLDCENNYAIIPGETNQSFTAKSNGSYALKITENGCTDTSSCHAITNVGLFEIGFNSNLRVYPNPTSGILNIELGDNCLGVTTSIYTVSGQLITRKNFENVSEIVLSFDGDPSVYMLKIETNNGQFAIIKIIKE